MRDDLAVKFRRLPDWPRYRVGTDRSVWVWHDPPTLTRRPAASTEAYRPKAHCNAKLDEVKVLEARRLHAAGWTYRALCARYDLAEGALWEALAGWTWSHVPMPPARPHKPSWRKLWDPERAGHDVAMYSGGRRYSRSAELLFRAAWDPGSLPTAWLRRLGPGPGRAAAVTPRECRPPLKPMPPGPPAVEAIAAAEVQGSPQPDTTAIVAQPLPIIDDDDDAGDGPARGSAHGRAKLDDAKVLEARRLRAAGWTERRLADHFGVTPAAMHYALVGTTWKHLPRL